MKANTAIGIGAAFGGLMLGAMMEGPPIPAFLNISALLIIVGGTGGATLATVGMEHDEEDPGALQARLRGRRARPRGARAAARLARREGAPRGPAGARRASSRRSTTTSRARGCSWSSTAPTRSSCARSSRPRSTAWRTATRAAAQPFEKAGGFAPTMGIIGTVMGLVHVLENLAAPADARPGDLRRLHRDAATASARPTSSSCRSATAEGALRASWSCAY